MIDPNSGEKKPKNITENANRKAEKVSDEETAKKLAELAATLAKTMFREKEMGLGGTFSFREVSEMAPEVIAKKLADFIGEEFSFTDEGNGNHTIGHLTDAEYDRVNHRTELINQVIEAIGDDTKYTPTELADKQRRARRDELKAEVASIDAEAAASELSAEKQARRDDLVAEISAINRLIQSELVPAAAHDMYDQTFDQNPEMKKERDCKVPAAILGYILEYFRTTYGVPIQVRFAEIRTMPHPYVEVRYGQNFEQVTFFDYAPKTFFATENSDDLKKILDLEKRSAGTAHPIMRYYEVNAEGLAQLDRDYQNW